MYVANARPAASSVKAVPVQAVPVQAMPVKGKVESRVEYSAPVGEEEMEFVSETFASMPPLPSVKAMPVKGDVGCRVEYNAPVSVPVGEVVLERVSDAPVSAPQKVVPRCVTPVNSLLQSRNTMYNKLNLKLRCH